MQDSRAEVKNARRLCEKIVMPWPSSVYNLRPYRVELLYRFVDVFPFHGVLLTEAANVEGNLVGHLLG